MSLRVQTQAETTKTSTKTSVVETIKYQTSKFGSRLMSENFSRPRLKHSIDGTTRLCLTHALKPYDPDPMTLTLTMVHRLTEWHHQVWSLWLNLTQHRKFPSTGL